MQLYKRKKDVKAKVKAWIEQGMSIGLVATMGYLHKGHISLMEKARKENDRLVVSIFVNPTQFGQGEDYEKYPRDMAADMDMCRRAGVDLIFAPEVSEMYEGEHLTYIDVDKLGQGLCGAKRPGHFKGVCTVVSKLFNIIIPNRAYFGQKDYQQLVIIKRMVRDLDFDVEIIPCHTIREDDGLAVSSRNSYLSPKERKAALVLAKSLNNAKEALESGQKDPSIIKSIVTKTLLQEPLARIDYVELVDEKDLLDVSEVNGPIIVAIAVFIGQTRLIDNLYYQ